MLHDLALEAPRLDMNKCIKNTYKEMTGFRRVAQIEKSSPDSPRLARK